MKNSKNKYFSSKELLDIDSKLEFKDILVFSDDFDTLMTPCPELNILRDFSEIYLFLENKIKLHI